MDFHAIKVMQKKNPPETAWIKALKEMVKDLKTWCDENCKMGVIWNAKGTDPMEHFAANPLGATPGAVAAAAEAASAKGKGKGGPAMPKEGLPPPPPELLAKMKATEQ